MATSVGTGGHGTPTLHPSVSSEEGTGRRVDRNTGVCVYFLGGLLLRSDVCRLSRRLCSELVVRILRELVCRCGDEVRKVPRVCM